VYLQNWLLGIFKQFAHSIFSSAKRNNGEDAQEPRMMNWTNESVLRFAGGGDPILRIQEKSRELVFSALEEGWAGPPYNPVEIAKLVGAKVVASNDITDARTISVDGNAVIEFNPAQPRERTRFSIAHEVAHLLFEDALARERRRGGTGETSDEWQLELLCNLAAAEFVMPIGSMVASDKPTPIAQLMIERRKFDVSAEAFMIRYAKTSPLPIGIFCASPRQRPDRKWQYTVDYFIPSAVAPNPAVVGTAIPLDSAIHRCTAIGYTDFGNEEWVTGVPIHVEYVGIPGYPGSSLPRAIGLLNFDRFAEGHQPIKYVTGDALSPRGPGTKILCQLVNDRAKKWGGGVARKSAKIFPAAEASFSAWIEQIPNEHRLGAVHEYVISPDLILASIVGQSGFGSGTTPRIRYAAVETALRRIASLATDIGASVHMPKIGTGAAGGQWTTVEDIVEQVLVKSGLQVSVYDLPPQRPQLKLF
jgi:Zn-dependent peptidase ImmA (M78 family)/O-acetyl-ADP-ribose deacetylase (regulator of RNase III)